MKSEQAESFDYGLLCVKDDKNTWLSGKGFFEYDPLSDTIKIVFTRAKFKDMSALAAVSYLNSSDGWFDWVFIAPQIGRVEASFHIDSLGNLYEISSGTSLCSIVLRSDGEKGCEFRRFPKIDFSDSDWGAIKALERL